MTNSIPSVSVVIPALNASEEIIGALDSIKEQDYPNISEVIVAAGDDETEGAASKEGAIVIANPSGRTPVGLNLAMARASGAIVVRCDAHARLPKTYVSRAVETMLRTGAANVGGMQKPVGGTYWESAIAKAMTSRLGAGGALYRIGGLEGPAETVYLGVYDREFVMELGGFDETFTRNQDYELNHRIIESGGVVWFDPNLTVEYRPRGSLRALSHQYFQYGAAKRHFSRVHPGSLRLRQMAPPALVVALASSIVVSPIWPWSLLLAAAYVTALSVGAIASQTPKLVPGIIAALATMHVSWGLGFLTRR